MSVVRSPKIPVARYFSLALLASIAFTSMGCQAWSGMGVPFSPARVPPPGTGTYGSSSKYYNNSGNGQAFQSQPAAASGFATNAPAGNQPVGTQTGGFQPSGVQAAGFVDSGASASTVVPASASISSHDGEAIESSAFGSVRDDEIPSMNWQP